MTGHPPEWSDAAWCERQYNPRLTVADAGDILAGWAQQASASRTRLAPVTDLRYGAHPRALYDLFRVDDAKGLIIFLHGGYWRALSKTEHSWVADVLVPAGYSVAVVNYPLCPEVAIDMIADHCRAAVAHIWQTASPAEQHRCLVAGHSAGGYLTAAMFATVWEPYGLPATPFCGGLAISGVFDPTPLICTSINELIRLTPQSAASLDLTLHPRRVAAPLIFAVGGDEPEEFHRQSRDMAAAWRIDASAVHSIAGTNHFSVAAQLAEPSSPVATLALRLLSG